MANTNPVARSLHDVGLAAWFGGSLMGAVGLNGGAATALDPRDRTRVASEGWKRWTPVNAAAIGAHLAGSVMLLSSNRSRIGAQKGVGSLSTLKTGLTVAALGVTAASRYLGRNVQDAGRVPSAGTTEPAASTPESVVSSQQGLRPLQWAIPLLTGAIVVVSARMGEQQRPSEVAEGFIHRLLPD
jgi:hypothetical protein